MKAKAMLLACAGAITALAAANAAPAEKAKSARADLEKDRGAALAVKVKAARAAFEKENGAVFQKTTLVDREAADVAADLGGGLAFFQHLADALPRRVEDALVRDAGHE